MRDLLQRSKHIVITSHVRVTAPIMMSAPPVRSRAPLPPTLLRCTVRRCRGEHGTKNSRHSEWATTRKRWCRTHLSDPDYTVRQIGCLHEKDSDSTAHRPGSQLDSVGLDPGHPSPGQQLPRHGYRIPRGPSARLAAQQTVRRRAPLSESADGSCSSPGRRTGPATRRARSSAHPAARGRPEEAGRSSCAGGSKRTGGRGMKT
jgi:hypothetical protein